MSWNSRIDVTEALERAGWAGDPDDPFGILRHPSGAVWAVTNDGGDCGVDTPGGGVIEIPGDVPDPVVIAAALAASGQLVPAVTVVCDTEGHAHPHTPGCPHAVSEPRHCHPVPGDNPVADAAAARLRALLAPTTPVHT